MRAPDSSAPQPPGARPAGPIEFRVRFNPLYPSGRLCRPVFLPLRRHARACRGIRVFGHVRCQDVDGRDRPGHDEESKSELFTAPRLPAIAPSPRPASSPASTPRRSARARRADRHRPARISCSADRRAVAEGLRLAVPVAELHPAAHHIRVGHRAAAVLAASDRDRDLAGDRAEPDFAAALRALAAGTLTVTVPSAMRQGNRQRQRRRRGRVCAIACSIASLSLPSTCDDAVDHDLRRVDLAVTARRGIGALAQRNGRAAPACPSSRDNPSNRPAGSWSPAWDRRASSPSRRSAGGQDEQPWLVNSSMTARAPSAAAGVTAPQARAVAKTMGRHFNSCLPLRAPSLGMDIRRLADHSPLTSR